MTAQSHSYSSVLPIAVFLPSGFELTNPQKSLIIFVPPCSLKNFRLPVAGEDVDDEEGDVDNGDEVTHGESGPVVDHLYRFKWSLF